MLRRLSLTIYSYLVSTKLISEPQEHLKLSQLCLDQFGISMFDEKLGADNIASHILSGDFAFFEYSIINWIPHLLTSLELDRRGILPKLSEHDLSELVETLSIYLEVHGMTPKKKSRAPKSMISAVKYLPQLDGAQRTMLQRTVWPHQISRIKIRSKLRSCTTFYETCGSSWRFSLGIPLHKLISPSSTARKCSNARAYTANGSTKVSILRRSAANMSQNMSDYTFVLTWGVCMRCSVSKLPASLRLISRCTTNRLSLWTTSRRHQRHRYHLLQQLLPRQLPHQRQHLQHRQAL
jgi:hypothetical protein